MKLCNYESILLTLMNTKKGVQWSLLIVFQPPARRSVQDTVQGGRIFYDLARRVVCPSGLRFVSMAALVCGLFLGADEAPAQTAVCSNTPTADEKVECKEDATSSTDIDILLQGVDIDVTGRFLFGVHAEHLGNGNIDIDITHSLDESEQVILSTIDTTGPNVGSGGIDILTNTTIATTDNVGFGVHALHEGTGGIHLDVSGNQIHTTAKDSTGVVAEQANIDADVTIVASSNRRGLRATPFSAITPAAEVSTSP